MALTDLSSLKAPGWQRIVSELAAPAPDDRVFLLRLLGVLGQVSGARQAVLFSLQGSKDDATAPEPRATLLWPLGPEAVDANGRMTIPIDRLFEGGVKDESIENFIDVRTVARSAASSRQTMIFGLEAEGQMYDPQSVRGHVIAVPIFAGMPADSATFPSPAS